MGDILPEPTDTITQFPSAEPEAPSPLGKRTIYILAALVIIALLALLAAFIYDYSHNHDQDTTRKQDLAYIASYLNGFYQQNHFYPTITQLNSTTLGAFSPNIDRSKFKDPSSSTKQLSAKPNSLTYAYQVSPTGCDNVTVDCTQYKLTATLADGSYYVVSSPKTKS